MNTLREMANFDRNIIAANSRYDAKYIEYFTGIKAVYLPSWCGDCDGAYNNVRGGSPRDWGSSLVPLYAPVRKEVLIIPYRSNLDRTRWDTGKNIEDHPIYKSMAVAMRRARSENLMSSVKFIKDVYGDSNPLHLVDHPAVVVIPYQVSTISLFEVYRMSVPMFVPSLKLLKEWCWEHDLMWEATYGWPERSKDVADRSSGSVPDPNGPPHEKQTGKLSESKSEWEKRFDYWMPLADFYQFKHIVYFDSWEDFFVELENTDLFKVSENMRNENELQRKALVEEWSSILTRVK